MSEPSHPIVIPEAVGDNCANCRFIFDKVDDAGTPIRVCRRYPPARLGVADGNPLFGFPHVLNTDWCGEWKGV